MIVATEDLITLGTKIIEMADRVKVGNSFCPGAQTSWGFMVDGVHFTLTMKVTPEKKE